MLLDGATNLGGATLLSSAQEYSGHFAPDESRLKTKKSSF